MTGAEHYREAEQRLRASDYAWQNASDEWDRHAALREAAVGQGHAILALAEAVAAIAGNYRHRDRLHSGEVSR